MLIKKNKYSFLRDPKRSLYLKERNPINEYRKLVTAILDEDYLDYLNFNEF